MKDLLAFSTAAAAMMVFLFDVRATTALVTTSMAEAPSRHHHCHRRRQHSIHRPFGASSSSSYGGHQHNHRHYHLPGMPGRIPRGGASAANDGINLRRRRAFFPFAAVRRADNGGGGTTTALEQQPTEVTSEVETNNASGGGLGASSRLPVVSRIQVEDVTVVSGADNGADAAAAAISRGRRKKNALYGVIAVAAVAVMFSQRDVWLPFLDKDRIQRATLDALQKLQPSDPSLAWRSHCLYVAGMAVWEFFGLATIPVETAAGMVFGWKGGMMSATGKLLGASTAYAVGRWLLADTVRTALLSRSRPGSAVHLLLATGDSSRNEDNNDNDNAKNKEGEVLSPTATAVVMKFSCFPEIVKNFGSALLGAVTFGHFFGATVVHGCTFTALWTWLGVETAAGLEAGTAATAAATAGANGAAGGLGMKIALGGVSAIGLVVSPLLMAWWVRRLQLAAATEEMTEGRAGDAGNDGAAAAA